MFAKTVPGPGLKGKGGLGAAPLDKPYYAGDLESGPDALYPGISVSEQGLRWGFIQKVRWFGGTAAAARLCGRRKGQQHEHLGAARHARLGLAHARVGASRCCGG
jgi:hypothetical protein